MKKLEQTHLGISILGTGKKLYEKCNTCGKPAWKNIDGIIIPNFCECRKKEQDDFEFREALEKKRLRNERIQELFEMSKLGKRFKERTFNNFDGHLNLKSFQVAQNYAENFKQYLETGQGLIFTGYYGTGKTHLAGAIANYLIREKQNSVIFGTLASLLGRIKRTFETRGSIGCKEGELMDAMENVDLLILDDLGKEKRSAWVSEKIFEIINSRYENNLPIIITSNFTLVRLKSEVDDACFSRLMEMCYEVRCGGKDYRIEQALKKCKMEEI